MAAFSLLAHYSNKEKPHAYATSQSRFLAAAIEHLAGRVGRAGHRRRDQYLGTWSGTWRGDDSSGHFQLTLERGSEGKVTGSIAVSQDGGGGSDYTAKLKSAGFVGDKFAAAYEPPDGQSQVNLKGTFTPQGADGDWSVGAKDQPESPAATAGTWKITKK
jgi:hypothetical protein